MKKSEQTKKFKSSNKSELIIYGLITILLFLIIVSVQSSIGKVILDPLDENGNVEVSLQDYFGEIQSYYLINIQQETTLTISANEEDDTITVSNVTGCTAGANYAINIYDNESFFQGLITSISSNNITFTPVLDKDFNINNSFIECGRWNMNVDGSTTPVIFEIHPPTNINWHIESTNVQCQDNSDWDSNNFCGRATLTNGLIVGVRDGYHKHLFLIYNNAGFGQRGYVLTDYAKAPAGLYGYGGRLLFEENFGAIIKLEGTTKDSFRYAVRDDFTGITTFAADIGGHKTSD